MSGSKLFLSTTALLAGFALKKDYKKWTEFCAENSQVHIAVFCATSEQLEPRLDITLNGNFDDGYFLEKVINVLNYNKKLNAKVSLVLSDCVYGRALDIADAHNIKTVVLSKFNDTGIEKSESELNYEMYKILIKHPIDAILFFDKKVKLICGVEDEKCNNISWNTYSSIRDIMHDLSLKKRKEIEKYYFANPRNCPILSL